MLRTSDVRATLATQTYQMKDGVSLEDMIALANQVCLHSLIPLTVNACFITDSHILSQTSFANRHTGQWQGQVVHGR
jgi:hypothetical protein